MRVPRCFEAQPLAIGQELVLNPTNHQHLSRALRMAVGNTLRLFNNSGQDFVAKVLHCDKKSTQVQIIDALSVPTESPVQVHIGMGMSLGDRMEYAIQKATEAGVTSITPLETERSELRLKGDRADKKQARWQQVAISAAEQCYRANVPVIQPVMSLHEWVTQSSAACKLVLHHEHAQRLTERAPPTSVCALIGPEGGLSEADLEAAYAADFAPVALGPRVLRTETAPVVLLAAINTLWGDY